MKSTLNRDEHEMLIDILIAAIYGYHCAITGKDFKNEDAVKEYVGKWDLNSTEVKGPILRNIVQSTTFEIIDLIKQE